LSPLQIHKTHQTRPILVRDLSVFGQLVYLKVPRRLLGETHAEVSSARFHPQVKLFSGINLLTAEPGGILIHFGQGHDSKYGEETIAATPKNGVSIMDRGFCKLERIKDLIRDRERYFVMRIKNDMRRANARKR
jgi:putative transposase